MYVLNLIYDNIIVNHIVSVKNDKIIINIPNKLPLQQKSFISNDLKNKSIIISSDNKVYKNTLYLIVKDYLPTYEINNSSNSNIIFNSSIDFKLNTIAALSFTTKDGGSTWYVNFTSTDTFVKSVNTDKGPVVIIDGNDIKVKSKGPTIVQEVKMIEKQIDDFDETIVSDIIGEVIKNLPNMIRIKIKDTEIITEKI